MILSGTSPIVTHKSETEICETKNAPVALLMGFRNAGICVQAAKRKFNGSLYPFLPPHPGLLPKAPREISTSKSCIEQTIKSRDKTKHRRWCPDRKILGASTTSIAGAWAIEHEAVAQTERKLTQSAPGEWDKTFSQCENCSISPWY